MRVYDDPSSAEVVAARLAELPPLVTSGEVERLKSQLAAAQRGERFLLWGGDCAETFAECSPQAVTSKLKILLQMSLVLIHGSKKPVIRVGRFAGQYAKPRSSPTETRAVGGVPVTLPSYFGDLFNRNAFTAEARRPDPALMLTGYQHAALTLNFVRALLDAGFADLHHPEYWDLGFLKRAALTAEVRAEYQRMTGVLAEGLRFMEALGETNIDELSTAEFYTSHEGLNLYYESAQTRRVPRRSGYYNLTTHLPWIGDRTRSPDGAHVEYFRGIRNPVGVKLGAATRPEELPALLRTLNPSGEPGRILLVTRLGAGRVAELLPPIVEATRRAGTPVLWVCDPMHANTVTARGGAKTRNFDDILRELQGTLEVHARLGTTLGGVHIELTGEDVTECVGGAAGITEDDLARNYASPCDPRLNYEQAMELAFLLARRLAPPPAGGLDFGT